MKLQDYLFDCLFPQMNLFLFYPSGRFTNLVQDYVYSLEAFVADVGGYLVTLLE